jgi:hexokinase
LSLHILKQAIKDKIITFNKSEELLAINHLESRLLNQFINNPLALEGPLGSLFAPNETDAIAAVLYTVSIITERGALYSAAVLAAIAERINTENYPYSPLRIAVEGTTFLRYKGMRRSLEAWLHYLIKDKPYYLMPVEQASLYGAAVAAASRDCQ